MNLDLSKIKLTYLALRYLLDTYGAEHDGPEGHGHNLELVDGQVAIHDHPHSGRPHEIHFMVMTPGTGYQKVCEFGPLTKADSKDVAPGYVAFLAEWAGIPVGHVDWKNRIMEDNGLTPPGRATIDQIALDVQRALTRGSDLELETAAAALASAVLDAHAIHAHYGAALTGERDTGVPRTQVLYASDGSRRTVRMS